MKKAGRTEVSTAEKKYLKRIGNIRILHEIGRGASATVYKGKPPLIIWLGQDGNGMDVAVKEISRRILNERLLESLKQEIEILKSMSSPNIIRLQEVKKSSKHFYLVTEYCNGGDLQKFLRAHKRLEEHVVQQIVYQLSRGLKEIAQRRILHRDLKLSNLLISYEGGKYWVKIGDFGFARVMSNKGEARTFCGTAPNMAPEILMGYFTLISIAIAIMKRPTFGRWEQCYFS
eukprot:TRINITY_DN1911_c0_g2_i4.p2 TRINITY_DN1911_c0_g2~~TRINITY_DN1911_c0_g2_i4.p2  ORF type:complete len:231 (-),score=49.96 TRINITY_DN1911_c0_g2_i4:1239-1931(-)